MARAALPEKKKAILVYEEQHCAQDQKEPTKFYGYRDRYKSKDERTQVPNYAILIYDKKNKRFRLVPVENHVKFEKVRGKQKRAGDSKLGTQEGAQSQPQINIQAALEKQGITVGAKKENLLSKLRNNIRRNIAATNKSIITVGTGESGAAQAATAGKKSTVKKVKRGGKKKRAEGADSDDGDDGDKSCDFDEKNSDDEGIDSADQNKVEDSDDIGLDSDEEDPQADQLSALSGENGKDKQANVQSLVKDVMNKGREMEEEVPAGDKESDDDESLASELCSSEDEKPVAQAGQKRSFQQFSGGSNPQGWSSKRPNKGY